MQTSLCADGYDCQVALAGRESQILVHKNKFSLALVDPDLTDHSGIEVLKFLKLNHPAVKVVLVFKNKKRSDEIAILHKNLARMGVSKTFTRPITLKIIGDYLADFCKATSSSTQSSLPPELEGAASENLNEDPNARFRLKRKFEGKSKF